MLVWGILLADAILIVVTYTRLPPDELYHTSADGLSGGIGRAVVSMNFPYALISLSLLAVAANALLDTRRRLVIVVAASTIPMCLLAPFVVHQKDLDAAPANLLPALGVVLIAILTVLAIRAGGAPATPPAAGDRLRLALAGLLVLIAVPWLFALAGFYAPDPIYADEIAPGEPLPAVHLGSHHGLDGVLFAFAGLALSRALPSFRHLRLATAASAVLALTLAYGIANAFQDFALEQLWKRGTIGWKPPSVLLPSFGWLAILGAAAVIELAWFRRERRASSRRTVQRPA